MLPLTWLRAQWARITALPARLDEVIERAHAILTDARQSSAARQRAGRVWADAMQDRAAVRNLLSRNLRIDTTRSAMEGLGVLPLVLVVGGITAAAAMATLVAIFGRESTYQRELGLLEAGVLTPDDLERFRDRAPEDDAGGVAASIRAAGGFLKVALVGAAGVAAWKLWGKR